VRAPRVLVVGGGGREHAICWKLAGDRPGIELFAAPGNAGIADLATLVPIDATDVAGIVAWSATERPDLVVVGPDDPLALGIVDALDAARIPVIGPTAAAARIESSKAWAGDVLAAAGVPHPATALFAGPSAVDEALAHVAEHPGPLVVKADGLARGKGVVVCDTPDDAVAAIERIGRRRELGRAGERLVLQERLEGPELSVFAMCDGREAVIIGSARDHKRLEDGDRGPNTGGMGAFAPVPEATPELLAAIDRTILAPTLAEMARRGSPFRGFLYAGLMLTAAGPRVLEFNARLGDPEAQVVLPRLRIDLLDAMLGAASGRLAIPRQPGVQGAAVCVVMASGGYPGNHESGMVIEGLGAIGSGVLAFHAATRRVDGRLVTNGGRVLGITGLGSSVGQARDRAYAAIGQVSFTGAVWRSDIAAAFA
jgi:phosphoribosylamine---glycine ligase